MTPDKVEEWVEYCAEVCDSVEFLHGVPVQLPSETKALLRGRVRKALTQHHQDMIEDTGYRYAKMYPNEELRNKLCEFGIPRWKHNLAELGELLPTEKKDRLGFFSGRAINGWFCEVKNYGVMPYDRLHVELQHKTEADARAKMLIYLLENNLITK